MEEKVKAFLELATQKKASDIFIIAGRPLSVKIDGKLCTLDGFEERLMPPETDEFIRIIYKLAHDRNIEPMLETGDDDFSMAIPGLSRFRVNTYRQRGSLAAVIRIIAFNLPDPQDLHIPPAVMEAADLTKGMVLITGPAGSGKSLCVLPPNFTINSCDSYATPRFSPRLARPLPAAIPATCVPCPLASTAGAGPNACNNSFIFSSE